MDQAGQRDVIGGGGDDGGSLRADGKLIAYIGVGLVVGVGVVGLDVKAVDVPAVGIGLV